jgi:pentapeptide MXKDX repeat protein
MRAIDNGRAHSLRRGFRRATTNHNPRRTKNMLKRINALFIAATLLACPAVLPTFAQDKMKGDKMEGQDKMKDDKMKNDKMEGQDKMKDDKVKDDKMEGDKMTEKGKKNKKNKKGDKMEGNKDKMEGDKMEGDKMKEKKP